MMPLHFTDSHAHLDREIYDSDRAEMLARARQAGVQTILNIALGPEEEALAQAHAFTIANPGIYMAVGVHPHDVSRMSDVTLPLLRRYAGRDRVIAIGEIGLDYHYEHSPREIQRTRFQELLNLALSVHLPVIVHSREATEDTFGILHELQVFSSVGGLFTASGAMRMKFDDIWIWGRSSGSPEF